jgi:hypothetical protein
MYISALFSKSERLVAVIAIRAASTEAALVVASAMASFT